MFHVCLVDLYVVGRPDVTFVLLSVKYKKVLKNRQKPNMNINVTACFKWKIFMFVIISIEILPFFYFVIYIMQIVFFVIECERNTHVYYSCLTSLFLIVVNNYF